MEDVPWSSDTTSSLGPTGSGYPMIRVVPGRTSSDLGNYIGLGRQPKSRRANPLPSDRITRRCAQRPRQRFAVLPCSLAGCKPVQLVEDSHGLFADPESSFGHVVLFLNMSTWGSLATLMK